MINSNTLLEMNAINLEFSGEIALQNIDLRIIKNQIITLIGPNGAGKSSLVKIALGLLKPTSGKVHKATNLNIGYVPQNINVDPAFPLTVKRFLRLSDKHSTEKIAKVILEVNVENILNQSIQTISGGELKRVLLARALLKSPDLLILDEPTSGVDIAGQSALYALIQKIRDQLSCGVLLVSHNLHIVMAATDKVVCLNHHICCSGSPEHVQKQSEFTDLFGETLGIYTHHHDHLHDSHGNILNK